MSEKNVSAHSGSDDETEYSEIDVTDNPLYQVLSVFFENDEGETITDHLKDLTKAVRENTKMMERLLSKKK